ncbi:MAG: hypothetical protein ACUBOA_00760 [Candidatus Loosdrechtia sp.]|uniref:hypothetical protein n=1 Tax=Candidatus Loosdrechtia sp. TaxID=3101272 RepID=UPI003A5EB7A6|nr:MAG: hypothetical protein QY305_08690 [Candidatus Jettenia sp. AMX2]
MISIKIFSEISERFGHFASWAVWAEEEAFSRGWNELIARYSGPLHVRFILQPLVASIIAIRSGLNDACEGRSIFFWTLALKPAQRRSLLRQLWKDVGKLFLVACVLDVVYQLLVLRWVYPVQTVIVATVLAILPYLVFRGIANRLGRRIVSKKSEKEGER